MTGPLPGTWIALGTVLTLLAALPVAAASLPQRAQADNRRAAIAAAIEEASRRFGVPIDWIWHIIRAESDGDVAAVSSVGAMGLMQIMPATYADLKRRHGLGADPFEVRDNVLAGTAYLRELHDRYGAKGMLAAYNAGPGRWEDHVKTGRPLPGETRRYLTRLAPAIAPDATSVTSPLLAIPPPSPFAAPIFIVRTTVALPNSGAALRVQTTDDARSVDSAPTPAAMLAPPTTSGSSAASNVVARPTHPHSGALFVTSSSKGAAQ